MKLLIDTNILIPLEPTRVEELDSFFLRSRELARLAAESSTQIWLHPAQRVDLNQDSDVNRRQHRLAVFEKYPVLDIPVGKPPIGKTNDWVDDQLVTALERNAVTAFVTEDRRLIKKCSGRIDPARVLSLNDALEFLRLRIAKKVTPLPVVESVKAYNLDVNDPIWSSLREQYPDFDAWLKRCQLEHRPCLAIKSIESGSLAGVVILNEELEDLKSDRTLKICTFKVGSAHSGRRYGELLLKAVFEHAYQHKYNSIFVTIFDEHHALQNMLREFGFAPEVSRLETGEQVYVKFIDLHPQHVSNVTPLEYFIERGPFVFDPRARGFILPILPEFHAKLFPELQQQRQLIESHDAYGNGLRKAYLCRSNIDTIRPGDILFFYRSKDKQAIDAWGVVESVIRSLDPESISSFVQPRTVYSDTEIKELCSHGSVLAIRFRQILKKLEPPVRLSDMVSNRVLKGPPISTVSLKQEGLDWIKKRCLSLY